MGLREEVLESFGVESAGGAVSTTAGTTLDPTQERAFQSWYGNWARRTHLNTNPDDPKHQYDYRAAFQAGATPTLDPTDRRYHWPSQFKLAGHPRRFVGGVDTITGRRRGQASLTEDVMASFAPADTSATPSPAQYATDVALSPFRAAREGARVILAPPAPGESLLSSAVRGLQGGLQILGSPFAPLAKVGGDIGASAARRAERTGYPAAAEPVLRRGAEFVTNVLSTAPGPPMRFDPVGPPEREVVGRVLGEQAAMLAGPVAIGRALRQLPLPEPPQLALPPGGTRALPPGVYEAPGTVRGGHTIYAPGRRPLALPEVASRPPREAHESPTILPGRPDLGDAEKALPRPVERPPTVMPTAEEIAARRAGIDPTAPSERPLSILDAQGRPIMVQRQGYRPSTEAVPPNSPPTEPPRQPPARPTPPAQRAVEAAGGPLTEELLPGLRGPHGLVSEEEWLGMSPAQREATRSFFAEEGSADVAGGFEPTEGPTPLAFERTALGDQALIPGATSRTIPTGKTRAPAPQRGIEDTPLFGQERAARQAASDAAQGAIFDEGGFLDLGAMIDAWKRGAKRLRERFPLEEAVRKAVPASPVISEVERFGAGLADGLKAVAERPWWRGTPSRTIGPITVSRRGGVTHLSPESLKDIEERMVQDWIAGARTPQAKAAAIQRHAPPELRAAMQHRAAALARENQSRAYFGLEPIPETPGPYLPRKTAAEFRESVHLGGGQLGLGRSLQSTVRGHQQERVFETYRQGEQAGTVYQDPRNALFGREWEGLKLRATHRLFQHLERQGVLFRDKGQAVTAAGRIGQRPWRVERAPGGGTWWARSEQEAKFLEQNLTEPASGPFRSFVHVANALVRNPSLFNPAPHVTKNMAAKYLLARGPVGLATLPRDMVEYARGANPTLIAEFKRVMPFSESGETASIILGNELRRSPAGEAAKIVQRTLGLLNRGSSRVIFRWADPAMRYSLFKYYRGRGMAPYEAANHAWVDLIRYGTRSDQTDFWKSIPLNFFVPWRFGTFQSLVKQATNHPVRTALLIGGIDYLREVRYRADGKWTHLPWDYVEGPIAQMLQSGNPQEIAGILGTTAVFGPGGAFAASQLIDTLNEVRGRGEWDRLKNMFWGISQLYNLPGGWRKFEETGEVRYLADMAATLLLGEHNAYNYQPRRLLRDLPESLPGLERAEPVRAAEELQAETQSRRERFEERRAQHPRQSIEDRLGIR